jgi:hypothetical protein
MFQEHLKSCGYCQNIDRATKQAEIGHMIKRTKVASSVTATRSYSITDSNANANDQLKKAKLRELVKIVGGGKEGSDPKHSQPPNPSQNIKEEIIIFGLLPS